MKFPRFRNPDFPSYGAISFVKMISPDLFSKQGLRKQPSPVRGGPLENLWRGGGGGGVGGGGGGGGGGVGDFRAAGIVFRYQIPCMKFFRP